MENIRKPEVIETMQSELDKIYEEEYEERLEKSYAMGREEATSTIVQKMKSKGFPIEAISECTGLSISAVQAI